MYASYDFYVDNFGGVLLTAQEFSRFAKRASAYIDSCTINRAGKAFSDGKESVVNAIKLCCCDLAESFKVLDNITTRTVENGGELASESVGAYSRSMRSGSETAASYKAKLAETVKLYLAGTGLLYRGVGVCV